MNCRPHHRAISKLARRSRSLAYSCPRYSTMRLNFISLVPAGNLYVLRRAIGQIESRAAAPTFIKLRDARVSSGRAQAMHRVVDLGKIVDQDPDQKDEMASPGRSGQPAGASWRLFWQVVRLLISQVDMLMPAANVSMRYLFRWAAVPGLLSHLFLCRT